MTMIAITARIEFASIEDTDSYCALAKELIVPTREEPGCNRYTFSRDLADDKVVWIVEEWASDEDLTVHLKTDAIKKFLEQVASFEITDFDARKYKVSSMGPVIMPED